MLLLKMALTEVPMGPEERVDKLIEWFVKAAIKHAQAIEELQELNAANQVACLNRYVAALEKEGAQDRLLALLNHPDPAVSAMTAVYCMRQAPGPCSARLADLAQTPGMLGFRAEAALKRWESGDWSL